MDEDALIKSALGGDLSAFNSLVLFYQNMAYNVAYRILGETGAADDATQEAFISAYNKLHQYRGGSFKAWLLKIVTNNCYDELRRRKRQPVTPLQLDLPDGETVENPTWIADEGASPEDQVVQLELQAAIQTCINQLDKKFSVVLIMVDVEQLDYQTTADITGIPVGTVKSRLARARLRIQDCLQGFWELLPENFRHKVEV